MSRDLLLVSVSLFFWGIGESSYRLFQPLYLEKLGASPITIGVILGGAGIVMTLAHIPAGYLSDRIGRRIIMWAAWILGIISGIIMATAQSLQVFTVGVLSYGVTAFVVAPMNSYITAARGNWSVGRAISFTSAMYNLGAIIGPILGGWIGERFGYSEIYLTATIIFVLSTIFILLIKSQPVEKPMSIDTSAQSLFKGSFVGFLPIIFLAHLAMYIAQPLATNYLQNSHNLSLGEIGYLGAISSFGAVVLSLGIGQIKAGTGFIIAQMVTILFPFFLWQGNNMASFAVGHFMLGGFRSARSMAITQMRGFISSVNMGLAYGIAESTAGAAIIVAPIFSGFLYERDPILMFPAAIAFSLISIITTIVFTRKHQLAVKGD